MFTRKNMVVVAVGGALLAAAQVSAAHAMPQVSPVFTGPPSHVFVPTPGPSPRVMMGAPLRGFTGAKTFTGSAKNVTVGGTGKRTGKNFDGVPGDRKGNDPNWKPVKAPDGPKDAGLPGGTTQPSDPGPSSPGG
jgi:hypothetical protein